MDTSDHSLVLDNEKADQLHVQSQRVREQSMFFAGYWGI